MEWLVKTKKIFIILSGIFILSLPVNVWWSVKKKAVPLTLASNYGKDQSLPDRPQKILMTAQRPLRDDIFCWAYATSSTVEAAAGQEPVSVAAKLATNFKLVGVLRGVKNTVLVEDMANHKTLLVTAGQAGDLTLEKIDGNQVTLRFQGQLVELMF